MRKSPCELCNRLIIDNFIFRICHILLELSCMSLFLFKMFFWMLLQSFFTSCPRNFPCKCGHKAYWHLTVFKDFASSEPDINWTTALFKYKLIRDETQPLGECFVCMFKTNKSMDKRCFEFKPLDNLTYLENLYKKDK